MLIIYIMHIYIYIYRLLCKTHIGHTFDIFFKSATSKVRPIPKTEVSPIIIIIIITIISFFIIIIITINYYYFFTC